MIVGCFDIYSLWAIVWCALGKIKNQALKSHFSYIIPPSTESLTEQQYDQPVEEPRGPYTDGVLGIGMFGMVQVETALLCNRCQDRIGLSVPYPILSYPVPHTTLGMFIRQTLVCTVGPLTLSGGRERFPTPSTKSGLCEESQ